MIKYIIKATHVKKEGSMLLLPTMNDYEMQSQILTNNTFWHVNMSMPIHFL